MPNLDFNPRFGPFRFRAQMGPPVWVFLAFVGGILTIVCCCARITGNA